MEIIKVNHGDHQDFKYDIFDDVEKHKDLIEIFTTLSLEEKRYLQELQEERQNDKKEQM